MFWRFPVARKLVLTAGAAALVVLGLSNPAGASAPTTSRSQHGSPAHKIGPLSGKWSGNYSGAFSGTFKLTWVQLGQNLSGTIMVSGLNNVPTGIHGTVRGTSIRFGTVGSQAITYSGSVSGHSMSGAWQMHAGSRSLGGGSWSAAKSS
jgi:hypothetical protein